MRKSTIRVWANLTRIFYVFVDMNFKNSQSDIGENKK